MTEEDPFSFIRATSFSGLYNPTFGEEEFAPIHASALLQIPFGNQLANSPIGSKSSRLQATPALSDLGDQLNELELNGTTGITCPVCSKKFAKTAALRSHEVVHQDYKEHSCKYCFREFARRHDMLRHERKVHIDKVTDCATCFKKFDTNQLLRDHCELEEHSMALPVSKKIRRRSSKISCPYPDIPGSVTPQKTTPIQSIRYEKLDKADQLEGLLFNNISTNNILDWVNNSSTFQQQIFGGLASKANELGTKELNSRFPGADALFSNAGQEFYDQTHNSKTKVDQELGISLPFDAKTGALEPSMNVPDIVYPQNSFDYGYLSIAQYEQMNSQFEPTTRRLGLFEDPIESMHDGLIVGSETNNIKEEYLPLPGQLISGNDEFMGIFH